MGDLPGGVFLYDIQGVLPDGRPTLHHSKPISLRSTPYLYGPAARAAPPPAAAPPALSPDAAIVRYVRTQLARAGWHGEAFDLLSRGDPTWTRERWEGATAELAQAQAAWQYANTLNRLGDLTDLGDALDRAGVSAAEEDSLA